MTFQNPFSYHNLSSFRYLRGLEEEKIVPEEKVKQNFPEDEIQFIDDTPIESADDTEYITAIQEAYENLQMENVFEITNSNTETETSYDIQEQQIKQNVIL